MVHWLSRVALFACRSLNAFLKSVDVGEYVLMGDLEAYSCKYRHLTCTKRPKCGFPIRWITGDSP